MKASPVACQFLLADARLHKRLCPSVRPSVRPSVEVIKSKSGKMGVLDTIYACLCMERGLSGWAMDAPAYPSATML